MFDRETRREKVLENMAKEARIKASSVTSNGMKSAVISVKMKSKMIKEGFSAFVIYADFIKDAIFLSIIITALGGIDIIFDSGLNFATVVSNQFYYT